MTNRCPFCGGEEFTYDGETKHGEAFSYRFICNECGRNVRSDKPPHVVDPSYTGHDQ